MPGTHCAISTCKNTYNKNKRLHFHQFPKNDGIRAVWIQRCRRKDKFNPKTSHICSDHFIADDYKRDLKAELLNLPVKPMLKSTAVPSFNIPLRPEGLTSPSAREKRIKKRQNKVLVKESLAEPEAEPLKEVLPICESLSIQKSEIEENTLLKQYIILQKQYEDLKTKLQEQNKTLLEYKAQIVKGNKSLEKIVQDFSIETKYREKLENSLKHFLSKAQIQLMLNEKKKVIWSSEDISNAFAIRYFSKRCYVYLREKKKYPLPAISTLQRWASKLNLREGILKGVLRIMEVAQHDFTDMQRIVVLEFDEVKVESVYEYDKVCDEVVGRHSQMQVALVRGLFAKFKQPVYLAFDTKMTPKILLDIIEKLHSINYTVVACVSDCGGGNLGLWRDLNISIDKTYFLHPVTNEKIYCFADAPHLLKLIRNWLLDSGFILQDGNKITSDPLKHLLSMTDTEVNACYKLTTLHLDCSGSQRQNVRLAAELFSHTTATALHYYKPGPCKESAERLSNFIEKINRWFDVMNSFAPSTSVKTKLPYGADIESQNEILDDVYETIKNMKCTNKNTLQVFQKGILISILSLKALFENLKQKFSITYILTHRLNQDALENFFSQIRGRGGFNDHPSPMDAIYRIRMIILGKNPGVVQKNLNTSDFDADEYIVAKVLNQTILPQSSVPNEQMQTDSSDTMSVSSGGSTTTRAGTSAEIIQPLTSQWSESDGLEYLAGWVAKKFKNKYSTLGTHTYKIQNEHAYNMPSWIVNLSHGGLIQPSDEWNNSTKILEKIFVKFNKQNSPFRRCKGLVNKMTKIAIRKLPSMPEEVLKAYFLQRVYIRIKYLNTKKKITINLKRKTTGLSSQQSKKLKKLLL